MVEIGETDILFERRHLMMDKEEKKSKDETPAPIKSTQPSVKPSTTPSDQTSVSTSPVPPSDFPSSHPIEIFSPSDPPSVSSSPSTIAERLSYSPGDFSNGTLSEDGVLILSNGLSCKRIATSGQPVQYANGSVSTELFHDQPDGAAVFSKDDGGWYYVSNAEIDQLGTCWNCGGVGAIEFDANGDVIGYKRIASNLKKNCGGGATPWNSWISCEETKSDDYIGKIYQVDPSGTRPHEVTAMGGLGWYESFTYDNSTSVPTFYVTRDTPYGALTRFTPNATGMACYNQVDDYDRWCTLNNGDIDYLVISGGPSGTFNWTTNETAARNSANTYYPSTEGIDAADGKVFFVSKTLKRLVILDLAQMTYTYSSTESGAFDQQPDQVGRLVEDDESVLYFCEDGGSSSGVFGRSALGNYYTILEGRTDDEEDETTGTFLITFRNTRHLRRRRPKLLSHTLTF